MIPRKSPKTEAERLVQSHLGVPAIHRGRAVLVMPEREAVYDRRTGQQLYHCLECETDVWFTPGGEPDLSAHDGCPNQLRESGPARERYGYMGLLFHPPPTPP